MVGGATQDYGEAIKWYRKAAEQGYATAQLNLAGMYFRGHGVSQDYGEAVKWVETAAEHADPMLYWAPAKSCSAAILDHLIAST